MGAAMTLCVGTDEYVQARIEGGTIIPFPHLKALCDLVLYQTFSTLVLSAASVLNLKVKKSGSFVKQRLLEVRLLLRKC